MVERSSLSNRVLVIDDDLSVHHLFRACFRGWGDLILVADAEDGIRRLREAPPQLLVVGLPMTEGAGFRVLQFMEGSGLQNVLVMALSCLRTDWEGHLTVFFSEKPARMLRPSFLLQKPLEPDLLRPLVGTLLGGTGEATPVVLLASADVSAVEAVASRWGRSGVSVVHAPTGSDAVRRYEQVLPDMVFLWPHLPDMAGPEVASQIRAIDPLAVIFAVTDGETLEAVSDFNGRLPGLPFLLEAWPLVRDWFWETLRAYQWAACYDCTQAVLQDLTQQARRWAEEVPRLSKRVETLSGRIEQYFRLAERLIARVRGLLAFAQGHADLMLERQAVLEPWWRQYLEGLLQVVWDIQQVLDNLDVGLAIHRKTVDFQLRPVTLATVVRSVLDRFRPDMRQRDLQLDLDVPDDLPDWYGDEGKFRVILQCLVSNAVRFTPANGLIRVRLSYYPAGQAKSQRIPLHLRQQHDLFVLAVQDTGIGIRPEDQTRIFEPFQQISDVEYGGHQGLGLGLAIVWGLVEHMGGALWVESRYGVGSTFYVALPGRLGTIRSDG
ncbi:MAG: ATP-binding protein [Acidobacteria bacterium]|nr:ATP-binding protein [Acidobacteriota bacterium]MDW7983188.1 ATP-binding protein [Acidobacteriota bacterium]